MRFAIFSFAALAVTAGAAAQFTAPSLNPPLSVAREINWSALAPAAAEPATNAKRLAQGLPLKAPAKRRPHRGGPHRDGSYPHGATRVAAAPRAQTSPSPSVQQDCDILATYLDGTPYGYISPTWNNFGEYYSIQPNQDGALAVSFSYSLDSPSQLALISSNGPAKQTYPFVGAIRGFGSTDGNFGPGSYNYAYIGGTTTTDPGSPAVVGNNSFTQATGIVEPIESAIWGYNPTTYEITAQWISTDGSAPTTYIVEAQGVLVITGDVKAFGSQFGPATELRFKCVPPKVTPARV